ncbi:MAG TPA: hypothetical protein VGH38_27880 [Bryobacteraceae bacterium]|jgi:hypothetical protein
MNRSTQLLLIGLVASNVALFGQEPATPFHAFTLPAGTRIPIRLGQSLDTKRDKPGTPFIAHISTAVVRDGAVILPRGTVCHGHLAESKPSGRLKGRAVMRLALDSFELNGKKYTIEASGSTLVSKNHKKRNLALIGGGAATGAGIGAIAGGGVGAAVGAGAGAAVGTTGAIITGKRNLHLAPETRLSFRLREPIRVRV